MKKIFLLFLSALYVFAFDTQSGSKMESLQVMMKVKLIKDDGSKVTILNGDKFLELKTKGNKTGLAGELESSNTENGTYKGIEYSLVKGKIKAILIKDGVEYYTQNKEVEEGQKLGLTTDASKYDYVTLISPANNAKEVIFPNPLVISDDRDSSIVWVNQYEDKVIYETKDDIDNILNAHHIENPQISRAFLPALPSKSIVFDIVYGDGSSKRYNTITLFLDKEENLIGGFMSRPDIVKALNGSEFMSGKKEENTLALKFSSGDDPDNGVIGDDYFKVRLDYTTCSSFSNLTVVQVENGNEIELDNLHGKILKTSGSVICKDINLD